MKAYRIKYLPDGLYYCPSRLVKSPHHNFKIKSNLSKTGKIYTKKPCLEWCETIHHPDDQDQPGYFYRNCKIRKTSENEWEIEELQLP